jgi:mRNA interferase MazF
VWWCDLGRPSGSAPALTRPVVVVSDDRYNASALQTVTVVALTSNLRRAAQPGNITLPAGVSGLERDSVANVTQLATVDKRALIERASALPGWLMQQLDDGLRQALAL